MFGTDLIDWLLTMLTASPTPYHAVRQAEQLLNANGFVKLDEAQVWRIDRGGRYYFTRRDASIIAFKVGSQAFEDCGFRIIGAHTDSPNLKVKPQPEKMNNTYFQLGIEVYGGVLLNTWFDRDLSIAGRVTVKTGAGLRHHLVNFEKAIAVIPSLAIHLDRNVNEGRAVNAQEHMRPILLQSSDVGVTLGEILARQLTVSGVETKAEAIVDFDLSFFDTQPAATTGLQDQFINSARLDNLLSCFIGLNAFVNAPQSEEESPAILALFDHEEVGSQSDIGARSNMLLSLIERLVPDTEQRYRALHQSTLLSVDNAHGVHPNFASRHDENHGPILNKGPVIKYDANQGYATSSETASMLKVLASEANIPIQSYVTRADMRCGSTIGPMSAAATGIRTVDLGVPTFAMHSIREMAGAKDINHLSAILTQYLETRCPSL